MITTRSASIGLCEQPEVALARYGKTFRWASRLLGRTAGARVAALYAFCRLADELADTVGGPEGRLRLEGIQRDLDGSTSDEPAVAGFLRVARELGVDLEPARLLVAGLQGDLEPRKFERLEDLRRYAYLVAGTVGLLMCDVVGVTDRRARPFAIDLGIAMQFTNIARDVLEDARAERLYLPLQWVDGPLAPQDLVQGRGTARARAQVAISQLLTVAEEHYRSADPALSYLPLRARAAVSTASRCYEAIGPRILDRGEGYWRGRTYVGTAGKLVHTLRAFSSLIGDGLPCTSKPFPEHRRLLHAGLEGLPGVDA